MRTSLSFCLCCFITSSPFGSQSFLDHWRQCIVPQRRPIAYLHLLIRSLVLHFPVELSAWALLCSWTAIPVSWMWTLTQGSFHPCRNAGSAFGAGFKVQCPWKKQVCQYGKARLVFQCCSAALFCPSTIGPHRELLLGKEYQHLSFSKATNRDVFFKWFNTAFSRIALKAMSSVIIRLLFSYYRQHRLRTGEFYGSDWDSNRVCEDSPFPCISLPVFLEEPAVYSGRGTGGRVSVRIFVNAISV